MSDLRASDFFHQYIEVCGKKWWSEDILRMAEERAYAAVKEAQRLRADKREVAEKVREACALEADATLASLADDHVGEIVASAIRALDLEEVLKRKT